MLTVGIIPSKYWFVKSFLQKFSAHIKETIPLYRFSQKLRVERWEFIANLNTQSSTLNAGNRAINSKGRSYIFSSLTRITVASSSPPNCLQVRRLLASSSGVAPSIFRQQCSASSSPTPSLTRTRVSPLWRDTP